MKKNLIKALILGLEYELKTYTTKNYSYKAVESDDEITLTITVKVSESGCFHGLQNIYHLINDNLCSHACIEKGNLVITVF